MNNATVGKHPCPECGGDLQWNAAKQALVCPYCGTIVPLSQAAEGVGDGSAGVVEQDLLAALQRLQAQESEPPPLPPSAQGGAWHAAEHGRHARRATRLRRAAA